MMRPRSVRIGMFALLIAGGLWVLAAGAVARIRPPERAPAEVTALQVSAPGPPRYVFGSDGREHVDYDLVITDAFTAEVTLKSLTVTGAGKTLLELTGDALASHMHQIIAGEPSAKIPASSTVVTLVDVVMPSPAGGPCPGGCLTRSITRSPRGPCSGRRSEAPRSMVRSCRPGGERRC